MSEYLLSIYHSPDPEAVPANRAEMMAGVAALNEELHAADAWVHAGGLEPAGRARVITATTDGFTATDGPYLAAEEPMGGFWMIRTDSMESASAWAAKASAVLGIAIEVRAIQDPNQGSPS